MTQSLAWCYLFTGEARFKEVFDAILQYAKARRRAEYGYMALTIPPLERADTTPPAAVGDLAAEALGGGKVKLTWTAPDGKPVRYQVKWAEKPMVWRIKFPDQKDTHANWWAANNVAGEPKPAAAGTKQSMILEGVTAGLRYFNIRGFDAESNRSGFSNMAEAQAK